MPVVTTVQSPTKSISFEQVGGFDAHILVLTNPGSQQNYKWQFLTGGLRIFVDRKHGSGWEQLVSQVLTFPEYIRRLGAPNSCVWTSYGLNISTTGSDVLQGFDRQDQPDGSVQMIRTYQTFEEGIEEELTEIWIIPSSPEDLTKMGLKVSYSMTKNRGIVPDGDCLEGTWRMVWELSGISDIVGDNEHILGEDGNPLKKRSYTDNEFYIDVSDFCLSAGDTEHTFSELAANNKASVTFYPNGTTGDRIIDPTVGTTTSTTAIWSGTQRFCHYANSYYWCAYFDGTDPVIESSSDGTTWSSTPIQIPYTSGLAENALAWSIRFSGTTVIAALGDDSANKVYYRKGTLGSGTITWHPASSDDEVATQGSADKYNHAAFDSAGLPWIGGTGSGVEGFYVWEGSALESPSWTSRTPSGIGSPPYNSGDHAVVGFPIADSGDMYYLVSILFTARADSKDIYGIIWDSGTSSWGSWVEVVSDDLYNSYTDGAVEGWSATQTSDDQIHLVYIDVDGYVNHRKGTDANPPSWSVIDSDVTGSTDSRKISLSADGTDLYLFYNKSGDEGVYYRKYDGSTWGSESPLKTSDSNTIQSAISCYESKQNDEIGVCWVEGTGSPYNVIFDKISVVVDVEITGLVSNLGSLIGSTKRNRDVLGSIGVGSDLIVSADRSRSITGLLDPIPVLVGSTKRDRKISGSIITESDLIGSITKFLRALGSIIGIGSLSGSTKRTRDILGSIISGSSLVGSVSIGAEVLLNGLITTSTSLVGSTKRVRDILGSIIGSSTLTGVTKRVREFIGRVFGTASLSGIAELIGVLTIAGKIFASAVVSGFGRVTRTMSGKTDPEATFIGLLKRDRKATGQIFGGSTLSGIITRFKSLIGEISNNSTILGSIKRTREFIGSIISLISISGSTKRTREVVGSVTGLGSLIGDLLVSGIRTVSGRISGLGSLTGTVTKTIEITEILAFGSKITKQLPFRSIIDKILSFKSKIT